MFIFYVIDCVLLGLIVVGLLGCFLFYREKLFLIVLVDKLNFLIGFKLGWNGWKSIFGIRLCDCSIIMENGWKNVLMGNVNSINLNLV